MIVAKKPPAPLVKCDHAGRVRECRGCTGNRKHRRQSSCRIAWFCSIAGATVRCVEVAK